MAVAVFVPFVLFFKSSPPSFCLLSLRRILVIILFSCVIVSIQLAQCLFGKFLLVQMTTSEPDPDRRPTGRKIGIAVDLREENDHEVRWAVEHYLRPGDEVILLHVRPTSGLYGADFGSASKEEEEGDGIEEEGSRGRMEARAREIGRALEEAGFEYGVRIVKDKEMKERVCLEVERLGLSGLVIGRGRKKLGSVSGYCIKHCVCPVVVVRDEEEEELRPVPEAEEEEEEEEE